MSDPDPDRMRRQLANLEKTEREMLQELSEQLSDERRREGEFVLAGIQRAIGAVKAEIANLTVSA